MKSYSKKDRMKDLVFYCLIFCMSLGICVIAFSYPQSSSVFPRMLGVALVSISAIAAVNTWRTKACDTDNARNDTKEEQEHTKSTDSKFTPPILFSILVAIYLFVLTRIGFFVSTYFFIVLAMVILNYRNKIVLLIWPFILCATIWLAFSVFLKVPTPNGMLF